MGHLPTEPGTSTGSPKVSVVAGGTPTSRSFAFSFDGLKGETGATGPYYTPSVSADGVLSWSNNGSLGNPSPINIKGPQGEKGEQGPQGDTGLQGPQGIQGPQGTPGTTTFAGLTDVPDNVAHAVAYTEQTLEKAQQMRAQTNIGGPFLPSAGGSVTGSIELKNGYITCTQAGTLNEIIIKAANGGVLALRTGDSTQAPGSFILQAINGDVINSLEGLSDGRLFWSGQEIDAVVSYGTNHIRYKSGLQICWGFIAPGSASPITITFPIGFTNVYAVLDTGLWGTTANIPNWAVANVTTTNFLHYSENSSMAAYWIAFGSWK